MEPEVRYCTTADGVRIAYTVTGDGPVYLSLLDPIVSHVGLEWSHPLHAPHLELEARYFKLVRMDPRGAGLSERVVPKTLDDTLLDIEAVVEKLGLRSFTLHSNTSATPTAIAFAARHPALVSRMVIVDGVARGAELNATPQAAAILAAAAADWETATEAIGAIAFGSGREGALGHGAFIRSCVEPDYFLSRALASVDVLKEAASLSMPVLLVRHKGLRVITDQMTHDLVSAIPDARLISLEGLWADDPDAMLRRIAKFVYEGEPSSDRQRGDIAESNRAPRAVHVTATGSGVRTVLFTDLVGHTEMMRRLGDARGREVLREHERMTRDAIAQHGGTEIKTDGDSFMVSFGSVAAAMECAVELQRAFASRNEGAEEPLRVRMGLNAGEPIGDEGDLFGESVILAARIKDQAEEGEILVAEPVRHLLAGKGFVFADRGTFVPKGFEDVVRLFEVRWRG